MAVTSSLYPFNSVLHSQARVRVVSQGGNIAEMIIFLRNNSGASYHVSRSWSVGRLGMLPPHAYSKILEPYRKSRYAQTLSTYDGDEDEDEDEEEEDDDHDWLLDDDFAEPVDFEVNGKRFRSQKRIEEKQGNLRPSALRTSKTTQQKCSVKNNYGNRGKTKFTDSWDTDGKEKPKTMKSSGNRYQKLSEEIDMDKKWLPLLDYLSTFGLKESHFLQMYERHMPSLQINVCSAQERLEYLLSVGVKHRDIKRILLRQPQILGYTVENNLKSHVSFLMGLGIPNSKIGQIIAVTPSLFSYSVENSLKPTVRYLVEELGINEKNIGKVVQLSPQILVQRIEISWNTRYMFLSKELGASRDSVVKMVTKHPQLLHYSIDDGLLPRINFLRSIGMCNSDILKVLTSLTQVLSLSLEDNLKPKYMYLVKELRNEVQSLTKYPMYLSLSLDQRIRPRHRFLVSLKKTPKGPFPLGSFFPTDECFCQQWAGTSLDKYLAFRQQLLLKEFTK